MVYSVSGTGNNKIAFINGSNGQYGSASGNSLRRAALFGKNSVANFKEYTTGEFGKKAGADNPPSWNYENQYSPDANPNNDRFKMALMGHSSEDLKSLPGYDPKLKGVPVEVMDIFLKQSYGEKATAKGLDTNNNGIVEEKENAAFILAQDMLDGQDMNKDDSFDSKKIDGKITKSGADNAVVLLSEKNVKKSREILGFYQDKFKLQGSQDELSRIDSDNDVSLNSNNQDESIPCAECENQSNIPTEDEDNPGFFKQIFGGVMNMFKSFMGMFGF